MENEIKGTEINSVGVFYENIIVNVNGEIHYISSSELAVILSEFDFKVEKKRTRKWLHLNIDDYQIQKV